MKTVFLDDLVLDDAPICYGILMPGKHVPDGVPVVKVRDYDQHQIDVDSLLRTSEQIEHQFRRSRLQGGDILLSIRGTTGRVGRVPDKLDGANITQDSARIRVHARDRRYVYHMLRSPFVQRQIESHTIGQAVQGINIASVRKLEIPWLNDGQRERVVRLFDAQDEVFTVLARLVERKRAFKRALLHELLTGRRRFPEFARATIPLVPLGDVATPSATRNRGTLDASRVMGVLKEAGMVPMKEHVRADDLTRYQIVSPDGFAYNPMRLNIGSIARNLSGTDCLVSPDYVVFTAKPSAMLPAYLDQVRRSDLWSDFVRAAGSGSVRVRIYFRDLAEIQIPLPSLDEQHRIVNVLEAADREIALLVKLRDACEAQKRALMHRLLSGDIPLPATTIAPEFAHV